ncbi:MAG TPA: SRPBCC family protein [Acidimicrobiia bacterium]|nr:SRPBCC family protein [Acidimicrobiia bacterium]
MTRIAVSRNVPAPRERVWAAIADLGSHTDWMKDAERIVFMNDQHRGEGTRMEVLTVVGPFRTLDMMEVVGWDEGNSIEVAHQGLVKGRGTLAVSAGRSGHTTVSWDEDLTFPWWLGGPITAWLARPVLAAIWRGNLSRLEETLVTDP